MIYNLFVLFSDRTWEVEQLSAPTVEEADTLAAPIIANITEHTQDDIVMYFMTEEPEDA